MQSKILDKLEWPLLTQWLSELAQSEEGRERCLALRPTLGREEIEERWALVDPLRRMAAMGYRAPIGELPALQGVLKAAGLGQILTGQDLRAVHDLLVAVKNTHAFASDFEAKCSTLRRYRARLYPMPHIEQAIDKAVTPEGFLRDDASEELMRIRRQKLQLRKRIEDRLTQLLHGSELEAYLQDDFFTMRSERYVVPIRLDGRGRVKGSILDTSDSGQTLYLEPAEIAPMNDQLQEIELAEKLEIIRIFRTLSEMVAAETEALRSNYEELVELDFLTAQGRLAAAYNGNPVRLVDAPGFRLKDARHPLLKLPDGNPAVANTLELEPGQTVLIVSGPNAGGKTVVLKTLGLLHLMAKAGLLLPAEEGSEIFLFEQIHLELGDAQSLTANLSTFSGHLLGLRPILETSSPRDLVLLDELAVGTDPRTGAAIARAILEDLADRNCHALVTTHFDELKGLAVSDKRFRNGSMEFALDDLKPTYKLILDVPGQSYGLEVAEQLGLPERIIKRAKELRGASVSALDQAVSQLMEARDRARKEEVALREERRAAEAEKARWEQERQLLEEDRAKAVKQLADRYEDRLAKLRAEFDELTAKLKRSYKALQEAKDNVAREEILADRRAAESALRNMERAVGEMQSRYDVDGKIPGEACSRADLAPGKAVYVVPLKKTGHVLTVGTGDEPIEVEVGVIKLRVGIHDLRLVPQQDRDKKEKRPLPPRRKESRSGGIRDDSIGLALQTPRNSLDLRGKDVDDAIRAAWDFIDRAIMRGEPIIILIHGHGTDTLKTALRQALAESCPYDVRFRPGREQEGGDGVTVVALRN